MRCPYCGAENEDNAIFCQKCNQWILAKQYEETAPTAEVAPQDGKRCPNCGASNEPNAIFCSQCDSWILGETYEEPISPAPAAQETPAEAPVKKHKGRWLKIGIPILAAVLIFGTLAWLWLKKEPTPQPEESGAVRYQKHIEPYVHQGKLYLIVDGEIVDIPASISRYKSYATSLDGTVAAILSNSGSLYYVKEDVRYVATGVSDYRLSSNGEGLVYLSSNHAYLHHASLPEAMRLTENSNYFVKKIAISPDGTRVALHLYNNQTRMMCLMCYHLGKDGLELVDTTGNDMQLISISNDGCIYLSILNNLYSYDSDGTNTLVGVIYNNIANPVYLNADQTQLIYWAQGGTYLSENGKEGKLISTEKLWPLLPEQPDIYSQNLGQVTPVYDFHGQFFTDSLLDVSASAAKTQGLYRLDAEGECQVIEDQFLGYLREYVDPTCRYLYYIDENQALVRYDGKTKEAVTLGQNVWTFAVSLDGKAIYYIKSGGVYHCDPDGGNDVLLYEGNVDMLYLSGNHLYVTKGQQLLCIPGPGQSETVIDNFFNLWSSPNGYLYVTTVNKVFAFSPDGKKTQLFPKT